MFVWQLHSISCLLTMSILFCATYCTLSCKITIIKRSNNESAVSAAAYQSGEKLFSEYDQEQKYYPYKNEVTHKEIMLPPHVPPEFADRNTL